MRHAMRIAMAAALGSVALIQGCAYPTASPEVYSGYQAQREQIVRFGTVESVEAVTLDLSDGRSSGLGAVGGGVLGAVIGGATIGRGGGSAAAAVAGGVLGAIAGNAVENQTSKVPGLRLTVRLDNGELRAIVQQATPEPFRAGDRVRLLSSGGQTRVTH